MLRATRHRLLGLSVSAVKTVGQHLGPIGPQHWQMSLGNHQEALPNQKALHRALGGSLEMPASAQRKSLDGKLIAKGPST
jgi:hypothetical protein